VAPSRGQRGGNGAGGPAPFLCRGRGDNTAACAFVENVTLGSVQNATGTVIIAVGAVGLQSATGASLPADTFAASVVGEQTIQSSSVGVDSKELVCQFHLQASH